MVGVAKLGNTGGAEVHAMADGDAAVAAAVRPLAT
jgi:hypothetical protein